MIDAVEQVTAARQMPMAQIALAWVLHNPQVVAPIVGVTRPDQLDTDVAAVDTALSADEVAALRQPYSPREPTGYT